METLKGSLLLVLLFMVMFVLYYIDTQHFLLYFVILFLSFYYGLSLQLKSPFFMPWIVFIKNPELIDQTRKDGKRFLNEYFRYLVIFSFFSIILVFLIFNALLFGVGVSGLVAGEVMEQDIGVKMFCAILSIYIYGMVNREYKKIALDYDNVVPSTALSKLIEKSSLNMKGKIKPTSKYENLYIKIGGVQKKYHARFLKATVRLISHIFSSEVLKEFWCDHVKTNDSRATMNLRRAIERDQSLVDSIAAEMILKKFIELHGYSKTIRYIDLKLKNTSKNTGYDIIRKRGDAGRC